MTYVIVEPCIGTKDASCVAVCPVDCIYEGEAQYYINADECIDCGACEPECPVSAIFADDSIPEQWATFLGSNQAFFTADAPGVALRAQKVEAAAQQPAQSVEVVAQGAEVSGDGPQPAGQVDDARASEPGAEQVTGEDAQSG